MGPLHGFPQAPKDIAPVAGMVTTNGSLIFKDQVTKVDSAANGRVRAGGAIFVGRTNSPEFGLGAHTYNKVYGTTRNAFDPSRTAGGSSGGAGVALALRMLPVADGSDMMGSLRTPAAFNNVFGYYIEVRNTHKDKVPETWIRKQTLVSAERYITEELKEYEQKILGAEEKLLAIEQQLYQQLVFAMSDFIGPIQNNAKQLAKLDCLFSFAKVAISNNYCEPLLTDELQIDIKEAAIQ
jgi:hypothetical protein